MAENTWLRIYSLLLPDYNSSTSPEDDSKVASCLQMTADVNRTDESGNTALHYVVMWKAWHLVPAFIQHGADVWLCNKEKISPLSSALRHKDIPMEVLHAMIVVQANRLLGDPDYGSQKWNDLLSIAVMNECYQALSLLVDAGASIKTALLSLISKLVSPMTAAILKLRLTENICNYQDGRGRTLLHLAAEKKLWSLAVFCVRSGADVNLVDTKLKTPLHYALTHTDARSDVVTLLISLQNINHQDNNGRTALHLVVLEQQWDVVPVLIQNGANVDMCDGWNTTSLIYASKQPDVPPDIFKTLISSQNINTKVEDDRTALHLVLKMTSWKLVAVLVQLGADLNACDRWQETPLHEAVRQADVPLDVVIQLVTPQNINRQGNDNKTTLMQVINKKRWDLVDALVRYGADVNLRDNTIDTPLQYALGDSDVPLEIVTRLTSSENINTRVKDGRSALYLAIEINRWDLVPVLLECGADVNQVVMWNETPLYHAIKQHGSPLDVVLQLISPHNIARKCNNGKTALYWAIDGKRWDLVPVFIKYGASINQIDIKHETPLQCATRHSDVPVDVITQLISPQNINSSGIDGVTALYSVMRVRRWDLVPVLVQHGADVNFGEIRNLYFSAIDIITHEHQVDDLKCLLQYLPMQSHLVHVEFKFARDRVNILELNDEVIRLPSNPSISVTHMVDIICHLLQQTCLMKAQSYKPFDDIHTNVDANIVKHVVKKHAEFEDISMNPAPLKKLCMVIIRQCLPLKTDKNFAKLGLPHTLLSLVSLAGLAEELHRMWLKGNN